MKIVGAPAMAATAASSETRKTRARWEVESKVLETFMKKFGSKKGLLMFASLTSIDWQQYVLKEDQMSRSRRRGLLHVHNAGSAWAAKIKAKRMIVAPSSNANKVEKKD